MSSFRTNKRSCRCILLSFDQPRRRPPHARERPLRAPAARGRVRAHGQRHARAPGSIGSRRPSPPAAASRAHHRPVGFDGRTKLEVTRECATFLVRRLAPNDELALVTYDQDVNLLAPLAPVDQTALLPRIGTIRSCGQTNLSGGWLKGVEELGRSDGEGPRKVLLLTDGLANVGVTDPGALVGMARERAEGSDVGTTTIGFGQDFDEDLLTAMADAGRGNAHYAPTPDAAPAIFESEFEGLMSLVAQNVSIEIRMTEDVAFVGLLNEFPTVAVPGGV
jgi:Ca-activated chloride channel family protein